MLNPTTTLAIPGPVGLLDTIPVAAQGQPRAIAVICHPNPLQGGNHSNKVVQTAAKALARCGCVGYCPNLRGVGDSDGEHDYGRGEVDDVLAVIDYAHGEYGNLPLILAGFSFGAFVAARTRERIDVQGMLLIGTAVGKYELPTPPVPDNSVLIHGEEDQVIPLADLMTWARPQQLPVIVFPGCGHFFHGQLITLGRVIERCFSRLPEGVVF